MLPNRIIETNDSADNFQSCQLAIWGDIRVASFQAAGCSRSGSRGTRCTWLRWWSRWWCRGRGPASVAKWGCPRRRLTTSGTGWRSATGPTRHRCCSRSTRTHRCSHRYTYTLLYSHCSTSVHYVTTWFTENQRQESVHLLIEGFSWLLLRKTKTSRGQTGFR